MFSDKDIQQWEQNFNRNIRSPRVTGGRRPRVDGVRVPTRRRKILDLQDIPRRPGETPRQALARVRQVVGRDMSANRDLVRAWNQARRMILRNNTLNRGNARRLFNETLRAFYRRVQSDPGMRAHFENAGFRFPGNGRAPVLAGVRGRGFSPRDTRLSIDHKVEIRADWRRALDPSNFRFDFARPNWHREVIQARNPNLR
jgi:hypothetical protein